MIPDKINIVIFTKNQAAYKRSLFFLMSMQCNRIFVDNDEDLVNYIEHQRNNIFVLEYQFLYDHGKLAFEKLKDSYPKQVVIGVSDNEAIKLKYRKIFSEIISGDLDDLQDSITRSMEIFTARKKTIDALDKIIGISPGIKNLFDLVKKASRTNATVLITGENGTGKELVAEAIAMTIGKLVVVNCSAIPVNLFESELFGYVKGAFTGAADNRIGMFEEADGGTLFLDEIGDMPLTMQTKLLRAIQEGEIRPIGSNITKKLNVRIIAATNRNLEEEVKHGNFREDLFYRLNVIRVHVLPLRERKEDIQPLVKHFLKLYNYRNELPSIDMNVWKLLESHSWPGNVRELENVIHRALVLIDDNEITPNDIHLSNASSFDNHFENLSYDDFKIRMHQQEREFLATKIRENNGSVTQTAKSLEINRTALHNRIKKLNLDINLFRDNGNS